MTADGLKISSAVIWIKVLEVYSFLSLDLASDLDLEYIVEYTAVARKTKE